MNSPASGREHSPTLLWSLQEARPRLWERLCSIDSESALAASQLIDEPPRAPFLEPFSAPPFYRPPGSYRCVFRMGCAPGGNLPVIAIKGTEAAHPDFALALERFRRPSYSPHTVLEHLIVEERKIPFCLSVSEALREASNADRLQSAHIETYGEPASLPIPLAVISHPADVVADVVERFRTHLSQEAFRATVERMHNGLAMYFYYYPAPPLRATDIESLLSGLPYKRRTAALLGFCDPTAIVTRWVSNFARMLILGHLPGSTASVRSGICCQPQNACLNGGFVDLESVVSLDELPDAGSIFSALQFCVEGLTNCVRTLLLGRTDLVRADASPGRFDLPRLTRYVMHMIERAIAVESRPGVDLDPRIASFLRAPDNLEELFHTFSAYAGAECEPSAGEELDTFWRTLLAGSVAKM